MPSDPYAREPLFLTVKAIAQSPTSANRSVRASGTDEVASEGKVSPPLVTYCRGCLVAASSRSTLMNDTLPLASPPQPAE